MSRYDMSCSKIPYFRYCRNAQKSVPLQTKIIKYLFSLVIRASREVSLLFIGISKHFRPFHMLPYRRKKNQKKEPISVKKIKDLFVWNS